jgi:hypothetical protein
VVAAEAKKARDQVAREFDAIKQQLSESEQLLRAREAKLAEAQQAQAEALRKQRELDEKNVKSKSPSRSACRQARLCSSRRHAKMRQMS